MTLRRHTTLSALASAAAIAVVGALGFGCASANATERAQSLVRQHREGEAVETLRGRIRAHPDDAPARKLLVRVLAFMGEMTEARAEIDALSARLPPGDPSTYIELGHAFELTHRYDEALAAYDQAASAAPEAADGPREGGMRAAHWGESSEAAPRLEEAIRRGAHDAETFHALGLVRVHLNDLRGAEDAYRAGAAAMPAAAATQCWLGLATVAVMRGDAQAALGGYEQVLARRPRFAAGELGRAWALQALGRRQEAAAALDRAASLGAPSQNVEAQRAKLLAP